MKGSDQEEYSDSGKQRCKDRVETVGSYEQPGYAGKKLEQWLTVQAGTGFELEQSVAAVH